MIGWVLDLFQFFHIILTTQDDVVDDVHWGKPYGHYKDELPGPAAIGSNEHSLVVQPTKAVLPALGLQPAPKTATRPATWTNCASFLVEFVAMFMSRSFNGICFCFWRTWH